MKRWSTAVSLVFTLAVAGCALSPPVQTQTREVTTVPDQKADAGRRAAIRLQLATQYLEAGQNATALEEIKNAIAIDPSVPNAYHIRALAYMNLGQREQADESFRSALAATPQDGDLLNNYGWFLCQNGKEKQSISHFETAFRNRAYQSPAKALNNAGLCSLKLKDRSAAEKYFSQAFQYDPGNSSTNANLAKIYFEQRDLERARFYVGRAMKADMLTADVLWLAIRIEHKLGDGAAEASLATQLRRRYPNSTEYAAYQRGAFDE